MQGLQVSGSGAAEVTVASEALQQGGGGGAAAVQGEGLRGPGCEGDGGGGQEGESEEEESDDDLPPLYENNNRRVIEYELSDSEEESD